tara:strand:+ start:47974 stop:49179 length:1206 start_codon:yes stop_codon:yes gene_type:complete
VKIALFNLHYSPNLGDGLIGVCMIHGLESLAPGLSVVPVDISGRDGFGAVTVRNRALALKVLRRLPRRLRHEVVYRRLTTLLDRVEPRWRAALADADGAVIGGGQLFSDADLNFPTKLERVGKLLAETRVPAAIHAVGVTGNWSRRGRALFSTLCSGDLRAVGVRDEHSRLAWEGQASDGCPAPRITRDPGLLSAAAFGAVTPVNRIALGITAPELLTYHADSGVAGGTLDFYETLALQLADTVGPVRLFCNGADEDADALASLAARPAIYQAIGARKIEVAEVPATPEQLVATVAPCRAVISHRLHANILGYAYARPVVGLGWDRKVESFFASVGLSDAFAGAKAATPQEVVALATRAIAKGIDPVRHADALAETRVGLAGTLHALGIDTDQGARRSVTR